MFKQGMLQFDSLLGARNFHVLVPHTPSGFSLPTEAFLGSSVMLTLRLPVRPVPSGLGLPSKSTPASARARKGRGLVMGSPSSLSKTILVMSQGLLVSGGQTPIPFMRRMHLLSVKIGRSFPPLFTLLVLLTRMLQYAR